MKKRCVLSVLLLSVFIGWSQDIGKIPQPSNELKINGFNLIAFTFLDFSYETLLNEESSLGAGLLFNIGGSDYFFDYSRNFSLTPYYRQYFSKQYAEGFFVEGFGMINSGRQFDFYEDFEQTKPVRGENFTDFALGISVGGKFVTPRGFVVELYTGLGRNLLGASDAPEVISRGGISLGFRF
ncbi:MAG: DUF3575 domain-containing protein [Flavobacteriaceae bacterium]